MSSRQRNRVTGGSGMRIVPTEIYTTGLPTRLSTGRMDDPPCEPLMVSRFALSSKKSIPARHSAIYIPVRFKLRRLLTILGCWGILSISHAAAQGLCGVGFNHPGDRGHVEGQVQELMTELCGLNTSLPSGRARAASILDLLASYYCCLGERD